jgi:hypothetical protein
MRQFVISACLAAPIGLLPIGEAAAQSSPVSSPGVFGPRAPSGAFDTPQPSTAGPAAPGPAMAPARPSPPAPASAPQAAPGTPASSSRIGQGPAQAAVRRQMTLDEVRRAPKVTMGSATVDFGPMLDNPGALHNVANRLRGMPDAVEVRDAATDVLEIDQGLVIRSRLKYRLRPAGCGRGAMQGRSRSSGGDSPCLAKGTLDQRIAELSDPRSPSFVADENLRPRATAKVRAAAESLEAQLKARAAEMRVALADPAQRKALADKVGQAEAERISRLSDEEFADEVMNSAEVEIEETMFVPRVDRNLFTRNVPVSHPAFESAALRALAQQSSAASPPLTQRDLTSNVDAAIRAAEQPPAGASREPVVLSRPLGKFVYLTGFTLGREYEWRRRFGVKIDPCPIFSCEISAWVEPYAALGYGFGLRFPLELTATLLTPASLVGAKEAQLKLDFVPINGNPDHYRSAGLAEDQLFGGKELVAEVGSRAGLGYRVPFVDLSDYGVPNPLELKFGRDFTELLEGNFRGGQFTPPAPGTDGIEAFRRTFPQLDLLGQQANFGVVGAKVYPAIKVDLVSNALQFQIRDDLANRRIPVNATGQTHAITIDAEGYARFAVGDSVYNLAFEVMPGIEAATHVDLGVWRDGWAWPVWFPELTIQLPPGGVDFSCHAGTHCRRKWEIRTRRGDPNRIDRQRINVAPLLGGK